MFAAGRRRDRTPRRPVQEPARSSGWIDPRARGQASLENAPLLSALNLESQHPLGRDWDIDFMSMEISPECLHLFSDSWEVGGSISRPADSDFEPGLELARAPYTLRLQSRAHQTMDESHQDWLRQTAANIRRRLPTFGPTRHPKLKPPSTREGQALALARCERSCRAEQLAACLEAITTADDSRLIICRYGVKYSAQSFHQEKLMAARAVMARWLGTESTRVKTTGNEA